MRDYIRCAHNRVPAMCSDCFPDNSYERHGLAMAERVSHGRPGTRQGKVFFSEWCTDVDKAAKWIKAHPGKLVELGIQQPTETFCHDGTSYFFTSDQDEAWELALDAPVHRAWTTIVLTALQSEVGPIPAHLRNGIIFDLRQLMERVEYVAAQFVQPVPAPQPVTVAAEEAHFPWDYPAPQP